MQSVPERSAEEIKAFCKPILNRPDLIELVKKSSGTNAAYAMVLAETGDVALARAGRWLIVLRNKYPQVFEAITSR